MTSYIYLITSKINNLSYIGKANEPNKRWRDHLYRKSYIGNVLRKYGKDNFLFQILDEDPTESGAYFLEWWNIKYYGTKTPNGFNLNDGGEGGLNPSEETRKKLSEAHKGGKHPHTEETKIKISKAKKGKQHTKETRRKMCEAQKNRKPITEETRKKMSDAASGKTHSKETREKLRLIKVGKKLTEEHKRRISEAQRKRRLKEIK